ncbi:MAG: hypothetical protein HXX81_01995 [Campylobacterales bacterium]|nr:hypothetical protein [Campylobacterales bacterium]
MIELIFSIVIIGISVISLPMIMFSGMKSSEHAFKQEAILAAVTKMENILGYPWDKNLTYGNSDKILDIVDNTDKNISFDRGADNFRIGIFQTSDTTNIRKFHEDKNYSSDIPLSYQEPFKGVEDFNKLEQSLVIVAGTSENDYIKKDINISVSVYYTKDISSTVFKTDLNLSNNKTNMKVVEILIKDDGKNIIKLKSFVCNIGEQRLTSKSY